MMKEYRLTIDELIYLFQYHAHRYYCLDNPAIEDYQYDKLRDELQKRFPECILLEKVGSGICEDLHKEGE